MQRVVIGLALALSMVLAGCFGDGEVVVTEESVASIWTDYERVDKESHVDERMFVTVDLRTNESTNTTWAVFDATYGGTVANTTLRLPSKGKSSTSVENTPSFPMTVAMFGTPTFRALYPMHSAVRLSPPTPEPRGWERAASSKPPTGTSSPCPGSPMLEAT